jgi:hypothetical protein
MFAFFALTECFFDGLLQLQTSESSALYKHFYFEGQEKKLVESGKKSKQTGKRSEQNSPGRGWSDNTPGGGLICSLQSLPGLFCGREACEMPGMDSGFRYTLAKQASGATSGHAAPFRNYCG